jgi:hypothetical protein
MRPMRGAFPYRGSDRARSTLQAVPVPNEGGTTMRLTRRGEAVVAWVLIAASITFVLACGIIGQAWEAKRCEVQVCAPN